MKQIKLVIKSFVTIGSFSFAHAFAVGSATCPPISAIQCNTADGKVFYFATTAPGY